MNIYRDFIETNNYPLIEILDTYENIFTKLDIDITEEDYSDLITNVYDEYDLELAFKKIILMKAQEEDIIPYEWDIDVQFNLDYDWFYLINEEETVEEIQKYLDDFKEWCGIIIRIK